MYPYGLDVCGGHGYTGAIERTREHEKMVSDFDI